VNRQYDVQGTESKSTIRYLKSENQHLKEEVGYFKGEN